MRTLILIAFALIFTACSPERRLQRLLARNPDLSRVDTITVVDTLYVPGDTLRERVTLTDTIRVENERQVVRIVRIPTGSPCDTARVLMDIDAQVKPDTVYHTVTVDVPRVVPCPPGIRVAAWWRTAAITLFLLLLVLVAAMAALRR